VADEYEDDVATETEAPLAAAAAPSLAPPTARRRKSPGAMVGDGGEDLLGDVPMGEPIIRQIPARIARQSIATGDPRGLQAVHLGRSRSGRAFAAFVDETGTHQIQSLNLDEFGALVKVQTEFRSEMKRAQLESRRAAAIKQEILETMAIAGTSPKMAALVGAYAEFDPKGALARLISYEEKNATGRDTGPDVNDIERAVVNGLRDQRLRMFKNPDSGESNLHWDVQDAGSILTGGAPSRNGRVRTRDDARRVMRDSITLDAYNFDADRLKETGGVLGLVGSMMLNSRGWNDDGGPIMEIMALAEREGWGWEPVPRPRNPEDVLPYLNHMDEWAKHVLGWPAFTMSDREDMAVSRMLARNDPRLELDMAMQSAYAQQAQQGGGQRQGSPSGGGGGGYDPVPKQNAGRTRETAQPVGGNATGAPEDLSSMSAAEEMFSAGQWSYDPNADPATRQQQINTFVFALSNRGMKDPNQIRDEVRRFVELSTKNAKQSAGAAP